MYYHFLSYSQKFKKLFQRFTILFKLPLAFAMNRIIYRGIIHTNIYAIWISVTICNHNIIRVPILYYCLLHRIIRIAILTNK